MAMFNPPHPGVIIAESLEYTGLFVNAVAPSTLSRAIRGETAVSPEMVVKLEPAVIGSARHWLAMQSAYDLWQAQKETDISATNVVFTSPDKQLQHV